MTHLIQPNFSPTRSNVTGLLLRDVASLLATIHLVGRSVRTLRPQCSFSPKLTATLDSVVATSAAGEQLLGEPLAGPAPAPCEAIDANENGLLNDFLVRLPAEVKPGVPAAKLALTLRLITRHVERKARLTAESALGTGQQSFGQALMAWAAEWRACSAALCLAD